MQHNLWHTWKVKSQNIETVTLLLSFFDKSLNRVFQKEQMDMNRRYCNEKLLSFLNNQMQKKFAVFWILHWSLLLRSEWCIYLQRNQTLIGRCLTCLTLARENILVFIVEFGKSLTTCFHGVFQIGVKATELDTIS